ncbi:hypothetical protein NFI96_032043 [Prochilodus magdalenae]|nr:hypothetical protein NFI96_032043 [Prochilodus magdalenae]
MIRNEIIDKDGLRYTLSTLGLDSSNYRYRQQFFALLEFGISQYRRFHREFQYLHILLQILPCNQKLAP